MHACMHACMHTYIHTYIHKYISTYVYIGKGGIKDLSKGGNPRRWDYFKKAGDIYPLRTVVLVPFYGCPYLYTSMGIVLGRLLFNTNAEVVANRTGLWKHDD